MRWVRVEVFVRGFAFLCGLVSSSIQSVYEVYPPTIWSGELCHVLIGRAISVESIVLSRVGFLGIE
jgi:hypothetical protein